ncbi:hypothetical protein RRG08_019094 [Elysia crispata]|uniref:Uncharacterized protein n=1 Tax=Elysia crispata TaxID=231223 RepID=A0AAE1DSN9_9GAST|nr:hypothetical protein RRG08_019094 [Elysia crispata]
MSLTHLGSYYFIGIQSKLLIASNVQLSEIKRTIRKSSLYTSQHGLDTVQYATEKEVIVPIDIGHKSTPNHPDYPELSSQCTGSETIAHSLAYHNRSFIVYGHQMFYTQGRSFASVNKGNLKQRKSREV